MTKQEIASFIKDERQRQKLSQQQLADGAGLSRRQQIMELECASVDYGIEVLIKVVKALGFKISFEPALREGKVSIEEVTIFDFSKIKSAINEPK